MAYKRRYRRTQKPKRRRKSRRVTMFNVGRGTPSAFSCGDDVHSVFR